MQVARLKLRRPVPRGSPPVEQLNTVLQFGGGQRQRRGRSDPRLCATWLHSAEGRVLDTPSLNEILWDYIVAATTSIHVCVCVVGPRGPHMKRCNPTPGADGHPAPKPRPQLGGQLGGGLGGYGQMWWHLDFPCWVSRLPPSCPLPQGQ